jgi:U3 small nucleolar RNA-associated protein 22
MYNTVLLLAFSPKLQLLSTHALIGSIPNFKDALTLLRVWANQRGYGEGQWACVTGFEGRGAWWEILLGILVHGEGPSERSGRKNDRKALGRGLSSYQLFRAALDFLGQLLLGIIIQCVEIYQSVSSEAGLGREFCVQGNGRAPSA